MDLNDPCSDACPCCPHTFPKPCPHTSTEEVLKRLCALVSDDDGCLLVDRQLVLINHLLGISERRIKMREVKYLTVVLEFLCEFLGDTPQYKNALWCLLRLCQKPPVLMSRSEAIGTEDILADYLTGLSNSLIIVNDPDIKNLIIEVLHNFLGKRDENDIPYDICVKALVKSKIGDKLSKLVYVVNEEFYPQILELTLKYAIMSKECAMVLLESDTIFWLLSRLELQPNPYSSVPSFISELTSSIIWRLLSYLGKTKCAKPMHFQEEIMKFLRNWFRREVLYGKPQVRNDITTIICRILYIFPADNVLKSGIFEDISLLAFATEFEIKHSWAKSVKFPPTLENLNFKKLLILIICAMFKHPGIRTVAETYDVLPGFALLLGTESGKSETSSWPENYKCILQSYVLHALPSMAEYLPNQYLASGSTQKILELLSDANRKGHHQSLEIIKCTLHCLNSLIIRGICPEHFIQQNTIPIVLDVACQLLKTPLTLMCQLLLSHCFILLSTLSKVSAPRSDSHHLIAAIGFEIAGRVLRPGELDSKLDGSLQITAVDFIWHSIVKYPQVRKIFANQGGVYLLLDLAKIASMPVQVLILGVLADLSEDCAGIPQLVTWRGDSETETVIALLCQIWRKQEAIKGVKRDSKGCINDSEAILEGRNQTTLLPSWKYCPAVTEMKGCARPKIYSVFYNIMRRHYDASKATRDAHGVDFLNLNYQDEITMRIINNYEYFKRGEVWRNLWYGLLQVKMTLLPQVEAALYILSRGFLYSAGHIANKQQSINANEINKELLKEKLLYDNLKSCMLTQALNSFMMIRNDLYSNSREMNHMAKIKMEEDFAVQREKMDIDIMVPEYHVTRLIGVSFAKAQPSKAFRIRKNSKLLSSNEYLLMEPSKVSNAEISTNKSIPDRREEDI